MASEYLVLTDIASNLSTYVQNIKVSSSKSSSRRRGVSSAKKVFRRDASADPPRVSQGDIKDDAKLLLNLKEIGLQPGAKKESLEVKDASFETTISPSLSFEARRLYQANSNISSDCRFPYKKTKEVSWS